jgi:hypothetical protein
VTALSIIAFALAAGVVPCRAQDFWPDIASRNPFTPFHAKFFLVAGSGEAGYRDGDFLDADFRNPTGLTISMDQKTLYVADTGNHAIRSIALDAQDKVSTLAGNGTAGAMNGTGTEARLSAPSELALSGDGSGLWVLDQAGQTLRHIDLQSAAVRTVAVAPKAASFTSLAVMAPDPEFDPGGEGVYLEGNGELYRWQGCLAEPGAGPGLESLGRSTNLDCGHGHLVALHHTLYFCNPCDGNLYQIMTPFAARLAASKRFSADSSGFSPFEEKPKEWKVLFWDPLAASFARLNPMNGAPNEVYHLSDYQGTLLTGPSADLVGINATSDRRVLLKQQISVQTGTEGVFFVSECGGNRLIGVDSRLNFENSEDPNTIRQAETVKPAGTTRFALVGDSMSFFWQPGLAEKRENINLSFVRSLELQLNLDSALRGMGRRYEVLSWTRNLGSMNGCPATYVLQLGDSLWSHQIDEVLIQVDYRSLWQAVTTFISNRTVDDMPILDPQADWYSMGGKARYRELGPLTRGLIDWVREHPNESRGVAHLDNGRFIFDHSEDRANLGIPRIQEFAVALMRKALLKCQALAKSHGASVAIYLLPTRDLVEMGEKGGYDYYENINHAWMDKSFSDMAASIGIPCYNLTEPARLMALPFFPLIVPADHHYNARAQGWLAEVLARQITGSLPNFTPDRSAP